jgi:hypothetical protein
MRTPSRYAVCSVIAGAVLEMVVLLAVIPDTWDRPATLPQTVLGFTQLPGAVLLGVFAATLGHALDLLPGFLAEACLYTAMGCSVLLQVVLFTFLIRWLLQRATVVS